MNRGAIQWLQTIRPSILCLVLLCVLLPLWGAAQTADSAQIYSVPKVVKDSSKQAAPFAFFLRPIQDSIGVFYTSWDTDSANYHHFRYVDTLNHSSGLYTPFKALGQPYAHLGVVGSASQSHLFLPRISSGFHLGIEAFTPFLWRVNDFKIIKTRNPYTKLLYVMGAKRENVLKVQHAQSFLDQTLGFQLDFNLYNHLGAYAHQHSDVKNFKAGLHYHTPSMRYRAAAYYYHNILKLQENGGIVNLNDFESNAFTNKEIIPVHLNNAQSLIKRGGVAFQQHFYLSKSPKDVSQIPDTNLTDYGAYKVKHYQKPYVEPVSHLGKLSHLFLYQRDRYRYNDKDQMSALYNGIPFYYTPDSTRFFDSITFVKIENEWRYGNGDVSDVATHPKHFNYYVGWRMVQYDYRQANLKKNVNAYALTAAMFLNLSKHLSLGGKAHYYLGNYMGGNYLLDSYLHLKWRKIHSRFGLLLSKDNAPWMMQSFASSRFTWQQTLQPIDVQKISALLKIYHTTLQLHISNIHNYSYYDIAAVPRQYADNLQHILLRIDNTMHWRHWGADVSAAYQLSSQSEVLRVPDIWGGLKLYYTNFLFKKALELEVGIENAFYTKYYADSWMPAIRAFHLQDKQKIGGYLLSDVYVNAKVGKARLFLRYDHFNTHFMG
ncbi:MAG: hypothetical protein CR996_02240, partial [Draconibacterium sp.]